MNDAPSQELSGNFLREGRQYNMASYRANLDLDLVMDLDQTLAVQRGSIKEAVQVWDQVQVQDCVPDGVLKVSGFQ